MESSLRKVEQNKYELTVDLGREELAGYVKQVESDISQQVKLKGFRKGKAPKNLIRDEVGDRHILEEALDLALRDSLARTIEKEKIEVLRVADLNIKENSAKRLLYQVNLTLFPKVFLGDLGGIRVKRKSIAVDRKEIDSALESLVASRSEFIPKDKPVEAGDRVEIDFEVTSQGLPVEGGISKSHPLIVGDNKFIPGFEDQLITMNKGEEKSFSLSAPKDYFHKTIAGKSLDFKVRVVDIKKVKKPDLNDEFARSLGRFKNLNDLEHNISEGILEEKKLKERQRLRLEILSAISSRSKIDLPEGMVKERLDEMVTGFDSDLHMKGMELAMYLAHLNKTEDDLRKDWREEAKKQVSFALILKKIAKDNSIEPSEEEINESVEKMAQAMVLKGETDPANINLDKLKEVVATDLTNEKVFNFLENNCALPV
ncbi:MAG: trigger factor [Candidatus Yanofskybacteria bacterium RIFCSPHIGHO2_02_FULL_41_29]|uniref:Trigger factor n=1 Tax=Candidatus Yanofskybacteria bacterium RIFCSPHIGHO2_01_FULL_41_53 TaxID=1802663 RepID=A0A1F8EFI9_9BACT|nr:MAG: trigger factor [Candidatus Yanofskybacteria bacterium RIFCSPHIGHO2_01_FULL_41_53]OGN10908.1 MAG: trigger factor [Candidatus Yanofskybacteria bacterium RIFCSPHIGHO2_02_FULL_41_29]OGN19329.1 MAG: trigger factor [Candidatus Yanofskybacteria bacterium RIFCSPHIGHO2_12_FULL_41_9]OGN21741.1 MAG: trigger factor [Candidatus Yanofskybacteria bacterium RIFCSPLOWO2_01_FULL_41_67]OGN29577.1 MAG: trigger factor [Candidatus Yanofskybacteria bacterium RIFCSPLOWO2_02_FULL_41_13]